MKLHNVKRLGVLLAGLGFSTVTAAHTGHAEGAGILAGFAHPWLGWDHLLAALAVGLLASSQSAKTFWWLPLLFVSVMAGGIGLAELGVTLWQPESMIIMSLLVFGAMLFFDVRLARYAAAGTIGVFAVFHGYLHGVEMPFAAQPVAYILGLSMATLSVHVSGIFIGRFSQTAWMKLYGLLIGGAGLVAVLS